MYQEHNTLTTVDFKIYGEPASKANSRKLVTIRGRPAFIKSKKARDYVAMFDKQCPVLTEMLEGDLSVTMTIFYATRRPDLDESVILDCMQDKIYKNDRQVKEKHIHWGLDRDNPRAEITVTEKSDLAND
jgi:Holliday junction resolvase RusA-like endonuclease